MACKIRRIEVLLNGVRQFAAEILTDKEYIISCSDLIEVLKNDVITVLAYQESGVVLDITPSIQLHRVTWITHKKEVGRNTEESEDGAAGGSPTSGCSGCVEATCPPPSGGPTWYLGLPFSSNCVNEADLPSFLSTFNANGYSLQNQERGDLRARAYLGYPTPDFSKYVDLVRPDCGWGWIQNGF